MEALHYKIPKMSIQPLVENACKYGLQAMDGAGLVTISASVAREYLRIVITDSGKGIEQSKLRTLFSRFATSSSRATASAFETYIGGWAVLRRSCHFQHCQHPNQGTTVSFEIPIRLLESREHEGERGEPCHSKCC